MISAVRKLLILGLILLILLSIAIYVVSKTDKTISRVDVVSNDGLVYVSKQDLINKVDKLSSKEWFDVNTESIEKYFQSFKGVDYTLVKKVWPSTLVIYLYDHKPIAYWNNNKILLDNMDIITPQVFSYDGELPYIESNDDDSQDYVYQVYQELNNIAKQNNTKIVKIYYQGNQFSLLFDNNIKVILGSKKLRSRLELFFNSYQKVKDYQSAEYFDMRYSDGFAVKYR
ncbi:MULTISPECIES: cell division protein FtsQ/DivIB [unclassified Francisella]|uniref:cell division protein FtsQ/DivIB n=1 Tax=unclassified Francisella TaxID=2610885 RepID=UPI002E355E65|nr:MULTISPECIES: cell division protein FtsQ/DivIB [unclassified Francisella]MED7820236.1 cell division protein FtsQ/DivIB [Francisella sp. 19S2-4]MED7831061.1 cell division protein FtsQ/DivIB [Francisella sp. 19S2-10]